jgi:Family of unknown function (DUF5988)
MGNTADGTSTVDLIMAVLVGGPASLPESLRIQKVSPATLKIKVTYYGGYEHFERTCPLEQNATSEEIAFHWTMRTEMAE